MSPPAPGWDGGPAYLDQLEREALMEDPVDAGAPRQFIGVNLVP